MATLSSTYRPTTTLSDPEISVVKEASCKPDLPRHSPRLTLLYKQPYKPLRLRVLPDTSIVPITPSRVVLFAVLLASLISNTLFTPLVDCLATLPIIGDAMDLSLCSTLDTPTAGYEQTQSLPIRGVQNTPIFCMN
jgi:hypothetical protein